MFDPIFSRRDRSHPQNLLRSMPGCANAKTPAATRPNIYRAVQEPFCQNGNLERGHSLVASLGLSDEACCIFSFFARRSCHHTPNNKTTQPTLILESAILKTGNFPMEIKSVTCPIVRR